MKENVVHLKLQIDTGLCSYIVNMSAMVGTETFIYRRNLAFDQVRLSKHTDALLRHVFDMGKRKTMAECPNLDFRAAETEIEKIIASLGAAEINAPALASGA